MTRLSLFCLTVAAVLHTAERIVAKGAFRHLPFLWDNGFVVVFLVLALAFAIAALCPRWRKSAEREADRIAQEIVPLVKKAMAEERSGAEEA